MIFGFLFNTGKGRPLSSSDSHDVYLEIGREGLPCMPLFRYFWFWSEYVFRCYMMIRFNFINLRYGRFREFFSKFAYIILHTSKMIDFDYENTFRFKFDRYDNFAKGYS